MADANNNTSVMASAEGSTEFPTGIFIGAVCAGVAVCLLMVCIPVLYCCHRCCKKRKRRSKLMYVGKDEEAAMELLEKERQADVKRKEKERKVRDKERRKQEVQEVDASVGVVRQFGLERKEHYLIARERLPELGSRLQKHWFRGSHRDSTEIIITEAPLTRHCQLTLSRAILDTINTQLLPSLRQHPYIHPLHEIAYMGPQGKIVAVQSLVTQGSLRDYIFKGNPMLDWSKKYVSDTLGLPVHQVVIFGRQILEALMFLYKQGLPSMGHLHSGNVFVTSDNCCKLGGYDNSLLGYRTRLYKKCDQEGYLKTIDVILFGRLVYEMGYGRELESLLAEEEDFEEEAEEGERLKEIINFIFDKKSKTSKPETCFKPIVKHKFFSKRPALASIPQIEISKGAKQLLETVHKGGTKQKGSPPPSVPHDDRKKTARAIVNNYLESSQSHYNSKAVRHLEDIGRRIGKYWSRVKSNDKDDRALMLSISELPDTVPISLNESTERALNHFFTQIQAHPYLHETTELHYVRESHHVILVQHLQEKGSLRDRIYATNPLTNWSGKLQVRGAPLNERTVALYGKQILQAVCFLYEQGFPPLGQLHTGNVFVEVQGGGGKEVCKLSGYENTLLGYTTSHSPFAHKALSNSIDLRMFGHMIYELIAGRVLQGEEPTAADFEYVRGSRGGVQELLSLIFSLSAAVDSGTRTYKDALQEVKGHVFFIIPGFEEAHLEVGVSKEMKQLLDKVRAKRKS